MKSWAYLLAGIALCGVAVAEEDIVSRMINKETNGSWFIQPEKPKPKYMKADVLGGMPSVSGRPRARTRGMCRRVRRLPGHSGEWKNYCASRVANASMGEHKSSVSFHLATARQVIDLGPVMVFNFGKGYDTKKLAFCDG